MITQTRRYKRFQHFFVSFILTTVLIILNCSKLWAQENQIEAITSNYFESHQNDFSCQFSNELKTALENTNAQEIKAEIQNNIRDIDDILNYESQTLNRQEKRLLKKQRSVLLHLVQDDPKHSNIKQFYTSLCKDGAKALSTVGKVSAHTLNILGQTMVFPIKFTYRFIKGATTGVDSRSPELFLYDSVKSSTYKSIAFYALYEAYKVAFSSNPYTLPLFLTPMSDFIVMHRCEKKTTLRPKEYRFCENYIKVKDRFFQIAQKGEALGAKLHQLLVKNKQDEVQTATPTSEISDSTLCEHLQFLKNTKTNSEKYKELNEILLLMNNPGSFSHPTPLDLLTKKEMTIKSSSAEMAKLRNIIISLSPAAEAIDELKARGEIAKYDEEFALLKSKRKQFGKLYRSANLAECQAKKEQFSFDYSEYENLKKSLDQKHQVALIKQHDYIVKQVNNAKGRFRLTDKTKLAWEIIPTDTLNTVAQILASQDVGNVIIVTHSVGEYKKLFDSNITQFPSTFFSILSPTIASISFYTCHSKDVLSTYNIQEKFETTPSIHLKRRLNFAQENNINGGDRNLPIMGFEDFLVKVDNELVNLMQDNMLYQNLNTNLAHTEEAKECTIRFSNFTIDSSSLNISINRNFIGNLNRIEKQTNFSFPCSILKEKNTMTIQAGNPLEKLLTNLPRSEIAIEGVAIHFDSTEHYYSSDKSYSSSKIIFSLN